MTEKLPWPEQYTRYYWLFRDSTLRLEQTIGWLIDNGIKEQHVPRLEKFLPKLEAVARSLNLRCRELEKHRGSERWPRWALNALIEITIESSLVVAKLAQSLNHLQNGGYWVLAEQRLQEALLATQRMRAALLDGPEPPGMDNSDRVAVLREAEMIADDAWENDENNG